MTIDRFWDLLAKKNCGEANSAELQELDDILLTNPEWRNTADTLSNLNFESTVFDNHEEAESAFETHLERMKRAGVAVSDIKGNYDDFQVPQRNRRSKKWLTSA